MNKTTLLQLIEQDLNKHPQYEYKEGDERNKSYGHTVIDLSKEETPRVYILGNICGMVLTDRGDGHISYYQLVEDDDYWCLKTDTPTSNWWLDDLIRVANMAKDWMAENAIHTSYGYEFKK